MSRRRASLVAALLAMALAAPDVHPSPASPFGFLEPDVTIAVADRPKEQRLRHVMLRRARAYLASGNAGMLAYEDDRTPVWPEAVASNLIDHVAFLPRYFPCLTDYLRAYPWVETEHVVDSFLYWAKETLGVKPIVSLTHVSVARFTDPQLPEAMVVAKQIYATHYKNGAITITAMVRSGLARYLMYVHRSEIDMLRGMFGGLVRRMIERRVRAEAPGVLMGLRRRLESGDPPLATTVPPQ